MPSSQNGREPARVEASAPDLLEELVRRAESAGASDIHLQTVGATVQTSFRLDGVMTPAAAIPDGLGERLFGRIKFLARLKTYQDSLPQKTSFRRTAISLAIGAMVGATAGTYGAQPGQILAPGTLPQVRGS